MGGRIQALLNKAYRKALGIDDKTLCCRHCGMPRNEVVKPMHDSYAWVCFECGWYRWENDKGERAVPNFKEREGHGEDTERTGGNEGN